MNETFFEIYNNRLDVALVDPKLYGCTSFTFCFEN